MHEPNTWYFFKTYMKDHKKVIVFFSMVVIIFLVIIGLYKLPLAAVGYAALLCLVLGILFFIYDFYFYRKRNYEIIGMFSNISDTIQGLPDGHTITEKNYVQLLSTLYGYTEEFKNEASGSRQDLMDYYTMWVHQVKTPIAAMKLLLQSSNQNISGEQKKDLKNELFKIEQYVEMALSYMRLESDSTDYVFKEYDLDEIIKQAVKKYSTLFISKKIKLDYQETGLKVLTDEKWLSFALEQILSNAVKYTQTGTVRIRQAEEKSDGSRQKAIMIEDTGIGIGAEDLPRIFEKGFTGYNGRVEKKSTGIGLFLTQKILNKLGHTIAINSVPGEGTRVIVDLTSEDFPHE